MTLIFQFLLKLWGTQLNSASGVEKMSVEHKKTRAIFTQTQVYLKPLLRKLKNKSLPEDISDSLCEIAKHLLDRNYLNVRVYEIKIFTLYHISMNNIFLFFNKHY